MQVNSINNNQNFGMALKIDQNAGKALAAKGEDFIFKLKNIGEKMKDYQYVDVFIKENATPVVKFKNSCDAWSTLRTNNTIGKPRDEFISISGVWEGPRNTGCRAENVYQLASKEDAEKLYNLMNVQAADDLSRVVNFAEAIETRGIKIAEAEATENARVAKLNNQIKDLMKEYGQEI
jgi:hypothetical protein